jgi:hypothetical protein
MSPVPGVDTYIIDELSAGAEPTATDTLYLLSSAGSAVPVSYTAADSGNATLDAWLSAYFTDGGRAVYVQGLSSGTVGAGLPSLGTALSLLPPGPGQVVAPEVTGATAIAQMCDAAWDQGKCCIVNGPTDASDATLEALAASVIATSDGGSRGAIMVADTAQYAGTASGETVNVPWAVTLAALVAKQDKATSNPGAAAAGVTGVSWGAASVSDLRSDTRRTALNTAQVSTAKYVDGKYRQYGIRSLANLQTLPSWWNWWGSRVVMAFRSRVAAVGEDFVFAETDGAGKLTGRFKSQIADVAMQLYDLGALFGATPADAYTIDTGDTVNSVASLQAGNLIANCHLKVSENAEHVTINIVRRALTDQI